MRIALLSFSEKGSLLGEQLASLLPDSLHSRCPAGGLHHWTAEHFASGNALIFIGAASIAVRAIAPYLRIKATDPAVLAIDELGRFVIPLLSGHIGGANRLAKEIAALLGATAVITTATDVNRVFAVDSWAIAQGLFIHNPEKIKQISAMLLNNQPVCFKSEHPMSGSMPANISLSDTDCDVLISARRSDADALRLIPPVLTLGVGCKKNTPLWAIEQLFAEALEKVEAYPQAIGQVASIDLKQKEPALLEFCRKHGYSFLAFSADELNQVQENCSDSSFVRQVAGVGSVCEQAALFASKGNLILQKVTGNGVAMALAISDCTLSFEGEIL